MLHEVKFDPNNFKKCVNKLFHLWENDKNKVFVLRSEKTVKNVKEFYNNILNYLGTPMKLGESVYIGDRNYQRDGSIWTEVRNDNSYIDAYRHSQNEQPLHTDGSYISTYPASTLMACVRNEVEGGETIFVDSVDIYNTLKNDNKILLKFLISKKIIHERSGDKKRDYVIKIINDDIFINWNYFCLSLDVNDEEKNMIDSFQDLLLHSKNIRNKTLAVRLNQGDSVLWKDNYCLHGRNSFKAKNNSDRFLWKCAIDIALF